MIGGVVDLLEIVDVEAKNGDVGAVPMHASDGVGEPVAEALAIGEAAGTA